MRGLAKDILTAFGTLTRLPLPRRQSHDVTGQARAVWAYPLVGAVVGALAACAWLAGQFAALSTDISSALALTVLVLATGALHEDGLADFADGLGARGGREKTLAVMRDSRIGTYGVIALLLTFGLRFAGINGLGLQYILAGLICSCVLGRTAAVLLIALLPPARTDGLGAMVANPPKKAVFAALAIALALTALHFPLATVLVILIAVSLCIAAVAFLAKKHVGGFTGDILGAGVLLTETAVLLVLAGSK